MICNGDKHANICLHEALTSKVSYDNDTIIEKKIHYKYCYLLNLSWSSKWLIYTCKASFHLTSLETRDRNECMRLEIQQYKLFISAVKSNAAIDNVLLHKTQQHIINYSAPIKPAAPKLKDPAEAQILLLVKDFPSIPLHDISFLSGQVVESHSCCEPESALGHAGDTLSSRTGGPYVIIALQ